MISERIERVARVLRTLIINGPGLCAEVLLSGVQEAVIPTIVL